MGKLSVFVAIALAMGAIDSELNINNNIFSILQVEAQRIGVIHRHSSPSGPYEGGGNGGGKNKKKKRRMKSKSPYDNGNDSDSDGGNRNNSRFMRKKPSNAKQHTQQSTSPFSDSGSDSEGGGGKNQDKIIMQMEQKPGDDETPPNGTDDDDDDTDSGGGGGGGIPFVSKAELKALREKHGQLQQDIINLRMGPVDGMLQASQSSMNLMRKRDEQWKEDQKRKQEEHEKQQQELRTLLSTRPPHMSAKYMYLMSQSPWMPKSDND